MDTQSERRRHSRRGFLKQMLVAGGALGTGSAFAVAADALVTPPKQDTRDPEPRGYRETAHVREYYAKASL